ncbi:MAG: glycosyltransferase [Planctomycetota bacterium]|nr:MAG: glycosyltransferase [Planctomycetota bacterium]
MNLACVIPDLSHKGGAESVVVWTAAGLARRGHQVRIVCGRAEPQLWPDLPELASLIDLVEAVPRKPSHREKLTCHRLTGESLRQRLSEFPLVFAHNFYGLLWSLQAKGPLLWYCQEPNRTLHARNTESFLMQALQRDDVDLEHPALKQLRNILRRQTRNWRRRWRTGRRLKRDRQWAARPETVLVNSSFSRQAFERALQRPAQVLDLGLPALEPIEDQPRQDVAVISSAGVKKNLYGVLQAARELERRALLPGLRFRIWGIGTDGPEFQEKVEAWQLQDRVELLGFLPDDQARKILASSQLCLFLPLCEPFGLVAVEALMLGTPILVSDHGGPAEILQRCGGGSAVDPLRPDQIAAAMQAMLAEPDSRRQALAQAREGGRRARELFSMESYLDRTESVLQQCLAHGRRD